MTADTSLITAYFDKWKEDVEKAAKLMRSKDYYREGILILSCYIGALSRDRYPTESKDWKVYKTLVRDYSGCISIYENIDLLFFYQWPKSKLAKDKIYSELNNYTDIVTIFKSEYGNEEDLKERPNRYMKREKLIALIKGKHVRWFDEGNFEKYIELFSNNQILYEFVRCSAVHNADFPLINSVYIPDENITTYRDNHQVDSKVIETTIHNIVSNLKQECISKVSWPWDL